MIENLNLFQDLQLVFKIRVSSLPIIDMLNKTRASPLSFPYCPPSDAHSSLHVLQFHLLMYLSV